MENQKHPTVAPKSNPPCKPTISLGPLEDFPLLSIVVPSFNQGAYICDTIESALSQNYRPIEIIIVDGASTDDTLSRLSQYDSVEEVRWISEPDSGVADAVNKGFAMARGDVIAIQSSDDFYAPGAFEAAISSLKDSPDTALAYGDVITIDEAGHELRRTSLPKYSFESFLSKRLYLPQPSTFFRREVLDVVGGWDESYFIADTEFWLRILFRSQAVKVDAILAKRRMHDAQRDKQGERIISSYLSMVRDSSDINGSRHSVRRLAHAGYHFTAAEYGNEQKPLKSSLHLWAALFRDPGQLRRWSRSLLIIPGYLPARMQASRLKKLLRGGQV